jgi:UTP--glucose-1-phosphate uridylyltransferase
MRVRKALIPAAGLGTRFLPATKALPKEMLAVVDKPVIQYAVEEAAASGIEKIGIITSRRKAVIEEHFLPSRELAGLLKEKGTPELSKEVEQIPRLADFAFIHQEEPLGLGHAVLRGEEFVGDEPFVVLNPDTIYDCPTPCTKQLIDVYDEQKASVVVLGRIDSEGTKKYGVVSARRVSERIFRILDLAEKPGPDRAFSDLAVLGRYVFTADIFEAIRKIPSRRGVEIQLTDAIKNLLEVRPVYGVLFEGRRFDAGDKFGFIEATIHLALKRTEFRSRLLDLFKSFD